MRFSICLVFLFLSIFVPVNVTFAQTPDTISKPIDSLKTVMKPSVIEKTGSKSKIDTVKSGYVNPGKVAGRKAIIRSLLVPGWGQVYNIGILDDGYGTRAGKSQVFQKIYIYGKIGLIYGGFSALTIAYIDSRRNYKIYLKELQYRFENKDMSDPNGPFDSRSSTSGLTIGKNTFKRNSQVIVGSLVLVYLANVLDAYITARLHFFNIDDNLAFNISPTLQSSSSLYTGNYVPSLRMVLTF